MDYTNIIIAGCTAVSTVIAISKILGKKFGEIDARFDKIDESLKEIKGDIHSLDKRISRIEDRLEFSNKIVYVQHEAKEN